jgi:hypothetical protein
MFQGWAAVHRRLCSLFVRGDGDFRLPELVRSAILASKPSASGECRLNKDMLPNARPKTISNAERRQGPAGG